MRSVLACAVCLVLSLPAASRALDPIELVLKGTPPRVVKGELVRQNLKGIVVKADAGPVSMVWTDVETVNGRPVADHVAALRRSMKDSLCPDCRGGLVATLCTECLGTNKTYPRLVPCDKCGATGTVGERCRARGCVKGRIDCPEPCLKRTVGVWREMPNYGPCRIFYFRAPNGGYLTNGKSEKHIGQVYEYKEINAFPVKDCPGCKGAGSAACAQCAKMGTFVEAAPRLIGMCKRCARSPFGRGTGVCPSCFGIGGPPCPTCLGGKQAIDPKSAAPCGACIGGVLRCTSCNDTGTCDPARVGRSYLWREEFRTLLPKMESAWPAPADRLIFRDGTALEGAIVQREMDFVLFAASPGEPRDLRVLAILPRQPFRSESLKVPPKKDAGPAPPREVPTKLAGSDVVVLKDGRQIKGRILMRSDTTILIETADGKRERIEMDRVTEVRSEPK